MIEVISLVVSSALGLLALGIHKKPIDKWKNNRQKQIDSIEKILNIICPISSLEYVDYDAMYFDLPSKYINKDHELLDENKKILTILFKRDVSFKDQTIDNLFWIDAKNEYFKKMRFFNIIGINYDDRCIKLLQNISNCNIRESLEFKEFNKNVETFCGSILFKDIINCLKISHELKHVNSLISKNSNSFLDICQSYNKLFKNRKINSVINIETLIEIIRTSECLKYIDVLESAIKIEKENHTQHMGYLLSKGFKTLN